MRSEDGMRKLKISGKEPVMKITVNTISCYFPSARIVLGVLEMPCASQKPRGAAAKTTELAQKLEIFRKQQPNGSHRDFFGGNERNMGQHREE